MAFFRNMVPRFSPDARKANMALVDVVKTVAERKGATPAQVALDATCTEALDRADSGDDQTAQVGGKPWTST